MWLLAIETATPTLSVALLYGGRSVAEYNENYERRHAQTLAPAISHLMSELNVNVRDLGAVVCGIGPGSFTGLRIGLSTAKGLAQGLDIPLIGVNTLDVLAMAATRPGLVVPLIDAKQNHIYTGFYGELGSDGSLAPLTGHLALTPAEVADHIGDMLNDGPINVCGDGVALCRPQFQRAGIIVTELPPNYSAPRASVAGELGYRKLMSGESCDVASAVPLYIRRPAAELKREERLNERSGQ